MRRRHRCASEERARHDDPSRGAHTDSRLFPRLSISQGSSSRHRHFEYEESSGSASAQARRRFPGGAEAPDWSHNTVRNATCPTRTSRYRLVASVPRPSCVSVHGFRHGLRPSAARPKVGCAHLTTDSSRRHNTRNARPARNGQKRWAEQDNRPSEARENTLPYRRYREALTWMNDRRRVPATN